LLDLRPQLACLWFGVECEEEEARDDLKEPVRTKEMKGRRQGRQPETMAMLISVALQMMTLVKFQEMSMEFRSRLTTR
jgi:hypothetical protein